MTFVTCTPYCKHLVFVKDFIENAGSDQEQRDG